MQFINHIRYRIYSKRLQTVDFPKSFVFFQVIILTRKSVGKT